MSKYVYNYEDIFEEDPGNPDNVLMTIPLEIQEQMGLKEGDSVIVTLDDDTITLRKNG